MGNLKSVMAVMNKKRDGVILGFDTSSKSLAFCAIDRGEDNKLLGVGSVGFIKGSDDSRRFKIINQVIPWIMNEFHPEIICIEQPIYINNFRASRTLSYVVGHTWGEIAHFDVEVHDIPPLTWKAYINAKNVTKADKQKWAKTMSAGEVKKKAAFERKERTRRIVVEKMPVLDSYRDDNIFDAVGIALYGVGNI